MAVPPEFAVHEQGTVYNYRYARYLYLHSTEHAHRIHDALHTALQTNGKLIQEYDAAPDESLAIYRFRGVDFQIRYSTRDPPTLELRTYFPPTTDGEPFIEFVLHQTLFTANISIPERRAA